ncbi:MAG: hypothetical protein ABEJ58_07830 [Halodesulfurarchaeum sp.]
MNEGRGSLATDGSEEAPSGGSMSAPGVFPLPTRSDGTAAGWLGVAVEEVTDVADRGFDVETG